MTPTYIFHKGSLLLAKSAEGAYSIPATDGNLPEAVETIRVRTADGSTVVAASLGEAVPEACKALEPVPLRASYSLLPDDVWQTAGKCEELLYWSAANKFCGRCGGPMDWHTDISKRCTHCGSEVWPQLNIAIIVRISRGDKVLLVHARNFKRPFYGLVAGFVETGETLEQAVRREVREETSLEIDNIRYFGSQPWPFPCGLMVGFTADYRSGELSLQQSELSDGGWFDRDHLPLIPEKLSIARKLIDAWLGAGNK